VISFKAITLVAHLTVQTLKTGFKIRLSVNSYFFKLNLLFYSNHHAFVAVFGDMAS